MLVHEPNGNLPTLNNPRTVDHFYRMYVLPVTTPAKTTNKAIHFISVASLSLLFNFSLAAVMTRQLSFDYLYSTLVSRPSNKNFS